MQNNLRNRSVALASTFALALSGLVAFAPAAYASNAVDLAPTSGTNTGAFITDDFEMDIDVNNPNSTAQLAVRIDNPSKEFLNIQFDEAIVSDVVLRGYAANGTDVDLSTLDYSAAYILGEGSTGTTLRDTDGNAIEIEQITNGLLGIDFNALGITTLIISEFESADDAGEANSTLVTNRSMTIGFQVMEAHNLADVFEWADGDQGDITVTAWAENEATPNYSTMAADAQSATIKWYDPAGVSVIPSIERFAKANGDLIENDAAASLGGKVRFVRPDLNLAQVDRTNWNFGVLDTSGNVLHALSSFAADAVELDGTLSSDGAGAIYFEHTGVTLAATSSYTVRIKHADSNALNTRTFNSAGFTPATSDTNRSIFPTVTDSDNAAQDSTAPTGTNDDNGTVDPTIELRPGVESFTYKARLYDTDGTDREKDASVLVVAEVVADYVATGETLTVSGSSSVLSASTQSAVVAGLSNSDGDFSVTVTSSDASALTKYTVQFFTVGTDGVFDSLKTDTGSAILTATYTAADVDSTGLTLANTVLSGDSITISASVADTYGVATNVDGTKALYLTAEATDTSDLDQTVAVAADGTATITFDNYVATGQSDLITVYLHTGASYVAANQVDSEVVSLYNPGSVAAVNAPATVTGNVTYDDFITGLATSTNVAPNDNSMSITGTVVDSNGQGIPGAVVTVDAAGMQLRQSGVGAYAQGTITFTASASGVFTVDMWSHVVDTTGVDVTITSGGKSATTTVKTYLPTGLSGGNLVFSIDAPANIDVNKTYAIQASLTDKWGNPVKTSGDSVDIVGIGSVEINSAAAGATGKNFGADGKVTVFVRSIKDIEGPGTITATLQTGAVYSTSATATATVDRTEVLVDAAGTVHDETSFSNEIEFSINVGEAAASSSDQKVNAGSFKGYVAVYARGYEGQRLSAKIGKDWVIVDPIVNNQENGTLFRTVDFTGAGVNIAVRIYIDRVLVDTINLTTK